MKKKILIFHPTIAPYRIDFFNTLNTVFDMKLFVYYINLKSQTFNLKHLYSTLNFSFSILKGITILNKTFRLKLPLIIKKENPDIIITNEFSFNTFLMIISKKIFRVKGQTITICDDSKGMAENASTMRKFSRYITMKYIDKIILCNTRAFEWYKTNYPNRSFLYFPIIQEDSFFRTQLEKSLPISKEYIDQYNLENKKIILFIGRLVDVKNIPYLIDEFIHINDTNSILILVGNGDKEEELRLLVKQKNMENKIIFPGRFEGLPLLAWYNLGQIFTLTSYSEAFGAVTNEALLAGIPCLISEEAGSACLINEQNGDIFTLQKGRLSTLLKKHLAQCSPILKENIYVRNSLMPHKYKDYMENFLKELST